MAGQPPACHEGVDGVDEHQQSEQRQRDVHLSSITSTDTDHHLQIKVKYTKLEI